MSEPLTITDMVGSGDMPDAVGKSDTTDKVEGNAALASEVSQKYTQWRNDRRPLEGGWFVNAALFSGLSNTRWNPVLNVLESKAPSHRSRDNFNIIKPKVTAKLSKFLKARPFPSVIAASTDHEDILNAAATTKILEYLWQKLQLEELYEETLLWAMQAGKAFWWFRWRESTIAQVKKPSGYLTKESVEDVPLGDVEVELGTVFELLVSDPGVTRLSKQPEIMRVKVRMVKELEQNYQLPPGSIEGDTTTGDLFQYQKQIAQLGARASVGSIGKSDAQDDAKTHVVVKELFTAPNANFPKGRYVVVAGSTVLHNMDALPYGFDTSANPFPVVEFSDTVTPGRFWPTTMIEQLTPGQTRFNRYNNHVDEHLKLNSHPKVFVPKQAQVPEGALNSESGQTISINFQPGMPTPNTWVMQAPPINGDIWKAMDNLLGLNDMISNFYPSSMGGGSGATSGFETNLLQEAAESVHGPDIRRNSLALKDAAYKIRRLVKLGYDVPRLISIMGRDKQPEVFEFSQEQVDEHANIIIEEGSALPSLKHARIEAILKLDERQIFGAPGDPQRNRRVLRMLELGSQDEANSMMQRDENHARLENLSFTRNEPVEDPMPWENHDIEYEVHTDLLKSSEIKQWPPEQRTALVRHTILHVKFKNPMNALQLAAMFGMADVVTEIQQTMMVQQQATAMAGIPGQPQAGPPQQGPPPQAPQAPAPPQ